MKKKKKSGGKKAKPGERMQKEYHEMVAAEAVAPILANSLSY